MVKEGFFSTVEADTDERLLKMLLANRMDVVIINLESAKNLVSSLKIPVYLAPVPFSL